MKKEKMQLKAPNKQKFEKINRYDDVNNFYLKNLFLNLHKEKFKNYFFIFSNCVKI